MSPAVLHDYARSRSEPQQLSFWKGALIALGIGLLLWDFIFVVLFSIG